MTSTFQLWCRRLNQQGSLFHGVSNIAHVYRLVLTRVGTLHFVRLTAILATSEFIAHHTCGANIVAAAHCAWIRACPSSARLRCLWAAFSGHACYAVRVVWTAVGESDALSSVSKTPEEGVSYAAIPIRTAPCPPIAQDRIRAFLLPREQVPLNGYGTTEICAGKNGGEVKGGIPADPSLCGFE
jgi:hypothetical protein